VLPDSTVIEYVIDGQGRRIGKKINGVMVQGFIYKDDLRIAAELDGTGTIVSQFVYVDEKSHSPDYMIKGGAVYRFVKDQAGSPRLVVNVLTGAVAQTLEYDEFGNLLNDSAPGFQPFGLAGGLYDHHTSLVRFGARDYDASTGRWANRDQIGFDGGSMNLYGYIDADPINKIDPSGNSPREWYMYCYLFGCGGEPPGWYCPLPPSDELAACAACQGSATDLQLRCMKAAKLDPRKVAACLIAAYSARSGCAQTVCKSTIKWMFDTISGKCDPTPCEGP
jgi:RHS repeat-associated protein